VTEEAISFDSACELNEDSVTAVAYSNVSRHRVKIAHEHKIPGILVVSIISLVVLVD
jgi:hypothetical protein